MECWWCNEELYEDEDEIYVSLRDENDILCKKCLDYLEGREGYMGYRRLRNEY